MSSEIIIQKFTNDDLGVSIRVVDQSGKPWFVAKDVAKTLGYSNPRDAILKHCKGGRVLRLPTESGEQEMKVIPEADVYRLILRSKLPQAEMFQDWVVNDVLPSIRKHGAYMTDSVLDQLLADPRHIAGLLNALADEREMREIAEDKLHYLKPDVPFGTPSKTNGLPRDNLVKPYWRANGWRKVTTTVTEWQRTLFD